MNPLDSLYIKMIEYYKGDARRIQHFVKVHDYARLIGIMEDIDPATLFILEVAAFVHDIGIKKAEEIEGSSAGEYQEKYGPAIAEEMLKDLGYSTEVIERVSYLVGHHHTYKDIDGLDYQILVEADFLVNAYEDQMKEKAIATVYSKIFKTDSGKKLLKTMYGLEA